MSAALASIVFDGTAYAMVLFVLSVGLSVTMGLMNVVNLAHGAFAMIGGYVVVAAAARLGLPFYAAIAAAVVALATVSALLERLLYARLYGASELDQVAASIGVILAAAALLVFLYGPTPQTVRLPDHLRGTVEIAGRAVPAYRLFLIAVGFVLFVALRYGIERTRIGARLRAAVDNRHMATSVGVDVRRLFTLVFALGGALSALGGGLAIEVLGMGPGFATQYLVLFLIVVAVGGLGSVRGTFAASLLLGIVDTGGKYLFPAAGGFLIYAVTMAVLLWRPDGLMGRAAR
ncbi:MAG TPA: branched-chain amino acid ABC transporter permease [Zeimonas sp.]